MAFEYVPLQTLADAVDFLIDANTATRTNDELRKARMCVLECYREFPNRDTWGYFTRHGTVTTQARQSAGTIAYDHTGGTEERLVTLSGATLPANAEWFTLRIGTAEYQIERVLSSATCTLTYSSNPGEDIAAGTAYELYRTIYPVPIDWRRGTDLVNVNCWLPLRHATPAEFMELKRDGQFSCGWQQWYTIRGADQQYSGMVFEFLPPPSSAVTWEFMYQADPRPIGLFGSATEYTTGTISVSGASVTGAGTEFSSRMIGSVIRFTTSDTHTPTGSLGRAGLDNPYVEQRVIVDVSTTTSLTIDQATAGSYSAKKYSIGDPLDLDYHVMVDAFLAMCQWKFAIMLKQSQDVIQAKEADWVRAFRRARAADYREPESSTRQPVPYVVFP